MENDLNYLLSNFEDLESFVYQEEMRQLEKGMKIAISFDDFVNNQYAGEFPFLEYFELFKKNPFSKNFLRKNSKIKIPLFHEDDLTVTFYLGMQAICSKTFSIHEDLGINSSFYNVNKMLYSKIKSRDIFNFWKNQGGLEVEIKLIAKSPIRITHEDNEFIFSTEQYLDHLKLKSKMELVNNKRTNPLFMEQAIKLRYLKLIDYGKDIYSNTLFIDTHNVVEIRHIWASLWTRGITDTSSESNASFLKICKSECVEYNQSMRNYYSGLTAPKNTHFSRRSRFQQIKGLCKWMMLSALN